jgi:hypothetical protein
VRLKKEEEEEEEEKAIGFVELAFVFVFFSPPLLLHGERKYRCSSSDVGDDGCCFRGGEQQQQLKKRTQPRRRGDFGYQRCELEEAFFIGESSGVVRCGVWEGRSMGRRRRRLTLREGFRIQE